MENNYLEQSQEDVNLNIENEMVRQKLAKELLDRFSDYRKTLKIMAGDMPIEALCLDKATENILLRNGLYRVYDLFDHDFTKVKGFGVARTRDLTASLDQFLAML